MVAQHTQMTDREVKAQGKKKKKENGSTEGRGLGGVEDDGGWVRVVVG